jgi:mono/diheme cytochrome c family protein
MLVAAVILSAFKRTMTAVGLAFFSCMAVAQQNESVSLSRGAYLVRAADCITCHTAGPKSEPFAGGLPINSPFGVIYSTNITPDPTHGIGNYSLEDFERAVRNGIRKDGRRLYPAMPYPSFNGIIDEDIQALYDFFMREVTPVKRKSPETRLPFPFNIRFSLFFWDLAFVNDEPFEPRADRDAEWNRGAYLVRTLGHCGACHTPRGLAFQETAYSEESPQYLSGAVVDNWFALNLRGDPASGLQRWSEADIVGFLKDGHSSGGAAFGSMTDVVENSMQYLRDNDLRAIARYLKSLSPGGEKSAYQPDRPDVAIKLAALKSGTVERPGAGLYASFCAKCHQLNGKGKARKYPKLAGNSAVLSENPASLIRLVIEGANTPITRTSLESHEMPSFARKLTDRQIAEVLSFIRNSWGNAASPVTARQVASMRSALQKSP